MEGVGGGREGRLAGRVGGEREERLIVLRLKQGKGKGERKNELHFICYPISDAGNDDEDDVYESIYEVVNPPQGDGDEDEDVFSESDFDDILEGDDDDDDVDDGKVRKGSYKVRSGDFFLPPLVRPIENSRDYNGPALNVAFLLPWQLYGTTQLASASSKNLTKLAEAASKKMRKLRRNWSLKKSDITRSINRIRSRHAAR